MQSILIKDTTREERQKIVDEAVGSIDGLCDGCSPGVLSMYDDYIEGRCELREVNRRFAASYVKAGADEEKRGCGMTGEA
ncbi:MAG: purine biosynthesis protein PurH [Clostridia bacterium]|nr:purine biosynthesis protein PurH [Clostridia bacterium]